MVAIEYKGHCSYEESVVGRVDTILGYSIYWDRVKEGQIIIDWAQGNGEGTWASECPLPNDLDSAVDYLQLAAMVRDLFCYLS